LKLGKILAKLKFWLNIGLTMEELKLGEILIKLWPNVFLVKPQQKFC
jgi:hypothetical protein